MRSAGRATTPQACPTGRKMCLYQIIVHFNWFFCSTPLGNATTFLIFKKHSLVWKLATDHSKIIVFLILRKSLSVEVTLKKPTQWPQSLPRLSHSPHQFQIHDWESFLVSEICWKCKRIVLDTEQNRQNKTKQDQQTCFFHNQENAKTRGGEIIFSLPNSDSALWLNLYSFYIKDSHMYSQQQRYN